MGGGLAGGCAAMKGDGGSRVDGVRVTVCATWKLEKGSDPAFCWK